MITQANVGGGTTLVLSHDDDLEDVPETHRDMITDSLRYAFGDPATYFSAIASRTSISNLGEYLSNFTTEGRWKLILADTYMRDRATISAFQWFHRNQCPCMFGLPTGDCDDTLFASLYDDLSVVHWASIGFAGGLFPYCKHTSVQEHGLPSTDPVFPADATSVFGNSSCGDMMIYSASGAAGYLSHENGSSYVVGSFDEMLDWVFCELLHNRTPEFDYSRCE